MGFPCISPRLHAELRESVERQLQALPVAPGLENSGSMEEEGVIKNLQEQMQLSSQVCLSTFFLSLTPSLYNLIP